MATTYLSSLDPLSAINGWGLYERNRSNGEIGANDGRTLRLNGVTYEKGLGVHAGSTIVYNLNGQFNSFRSDIGVDDEVGSNGSVVFKVLADGKELYNSGVMKGSSATKSININVSGIQTLELFVGNAGDNKLYDHADWANARLLSSEAFQGGQGNNTIRGGEGYDTVNYSQLNNGIIANLKTGKVLKPLYGTLNQPKIMPLGDSITAGFDEISPTPGAYRIELEDNFLADGLKVNFVGSQFNGINELADKNHEGHPGFKINQITNLVNNGILATHRSNVILLMIGSNDALGDINNTVSQMFVDLSNLINKITEKSPNSYLLVGSIAPADPSIKAPQKVAKVEEFNNLLPNFVADKAEEGKKVSFVDVGGTLSLADIKSDGIHPDREGYDKMGDAWYKALVERDTLLSIENITGTSFNDELIGNSKDNVITGGNGDDVLTGGGGRDVFTYQRVQNGYDIITDFKPLEDRIKISASGFDGGLVAGVDLKTTASSTGVFVKGNKPAPIGSSANFLYNTTTGILSFDVDGTGASTAQEFARLSGVPSLSVSNFTIVS